MVQPKKQYEIFPFNEKGKILIGKTVKDKIDLLHREVGNLEWSGIMTYKKTAGHISDPKSVVIEIVDLYPMDIGSHSYTEFDSEDPKEMCDMYNRMPSYMDHRYGLIHSHHNMTTFFSGEDMQELHTNVANYDPYYLSLIVNFKGEYTAKVAYLHKIESRDIKIFDEDGEEGFISTKEKEVMFTFDLVVEIENDRVDDPIIMERLEEIREKKKKEKVGTKHVGFQRWTDKVQNVQHEINFKSSFTDDVRSKLPKSIMLNNNFDGYIYQAFDSVANEINEKGGDTTFVYNKWADELYEFILDQFECNDFDEIQKVFREMVRLAEPMKNNKLYGDHVEAFINVLDIYIHSIETN